jgi:hypothetical protein
MVSLGERITDLPAAEASHLLSGALNSTVTVTVLRGQGSSASSHTVALVRLIKFIHCPHTMSTHIWVLSIKRKDKERIHTHTHTYTYTQVRDVSIDVAVPTDADVGVMVWPGANGSLGDAICPYTHTHSNTHTNNTACHFSPGADGYKVMMRCQH